MSISMEHLILKGTAIRAQMRKADKAFKELFVTPVRAFLANQADRRISVLGVARPLLRINQPKPVLDEDRAMADLRELVKADALTYEEMSNMILNGTLGVGNPEMVADEAGRRLNKTRQAYTVMSVPKTEHSVQWNGVDKTSIGKLVERYKRVGDLEGIVRGAAATDLRPQMVAEIRAMGAG